jgi:DNA polymerase I-like protein with 3'-5' exonuclease and polymerase domains
VLITVHDSIVSQVLKSKIYDGLRLYKKIMLEEPMEKYKWMCVPLAIDLEVGTSWGETVQIPLDETTWEEKLGPLL